MSVKRTVFYALAFCMTATGVAAPFDMWFEARIADGRTIRIHGVGDEYAARFTDEEGRNLVYNPQAGAYEYAEREDDETFRRRALERRRKAEEESGLARRWAELKASRHQKASSKPMLKSPALPIEYTKGRVVGVTLLVDFPVLDDNGVETNTLANTVHPDVTADDLRDLLNGTGFTKYGNISSVREYFLRESSGHLDYTNVVIGWIKAPYPREHYDDPTRDSRLCGGEFVCDMIEVLKADPRYETEFLPLLRQATVDDNTYFSRQSSAFGGQFRALNCFIAGNRSRAWANGLWPQKGTVPYEAIYDDDTHRFWLTIDSKEYYFWGYQITHISSQPMIGTFCHESGHLICGFPDLYTGSEGGGIGSLCLMSSNMFGDRPQHICAYLRAAARWVTPKELPSTPGLVTVTADIQDVWKFSHPTDPEQYYLIENRQESDYDYDIPGSGGVFIYRCDETGSNRYYERSNWWSAFVGYGDATNRLNFEVSVEQADGLYEVEQEGGVDGSDAWYFGNTGGMYAGRFNSETIPCARWRDGSPADINLSRFSSRGHTMTFWNGAGGVDDQDVANDYMEDSIPILDRDAFSMHHDTGWRVTGVNSNATLQADEPLPQFLSATAHTLWWRWEAPWSMGEILRSRKLTFETTGSHHDDGSELDTVIGIYVYSEEDGTFTAIAENDDADVDNDVRTSRVSFTAKLYETYYICVGGYGAAEVGEIQLSGSLRPMNDDWEDAIELPGDGVSVSLSAVNSNATATADEPLARRFDAKRTLWWKWTAPRDCKVKFDTLDSHDEDWYPLDTIMGVYTRSGETFTKIAETYDLGNDDVDDDSVAFMATGGVTYYVCVGVYGYGGLGVVGLHCRTWPLNDDWEGATAISGGSGTATCGGAGGATIHGDEPQNEPLLSFNAKTRCTVWWKWTAPETSNVAFDTIGSASDGGSALDTVLGVYTRSDGVFSVVAENDDAGGRDDGASRVRFLAAEGTTYYICVGSVGSAGTIRLNWSPAAPENDDQGSAVEISGASGSLSGLNANATVQTHDLDPLRGFVSDVANTVWWAWTAPAGGRMTFDTAGSLLDDGGVMDTVLGVYTNAASPSGGLLRVGENDNVNLRRTGSVTFTAEAGVTYRVCVGARGDSTRGTVQLSWGPAVAGGERVDLAELTSFDTTISDGTTVYGSLGGTTLSSGKCKVSIAPGATVTLSNATIFGRNEVRYLWAGLTCEGDATLVLAGTNNTVVGAWQDMPGIYVEPGCRLDVYGGPDSPLYASSHGGGAGIGGGTALACGDIHIHSGAIVATGGEGAAGIGGARFGACGGITIDAGVDYVVATRGAEAEDGACGSPVGAGANSTCGAVSVAPELTDTTSGPTRMIAQPWDGNLSTLSVHMAIATNGTIVTGTLGINSKVCVAPGATVTLRDATIEGVNSADCPWAGITCLGSATINLEGANTVRGFYNEHPGIFVPEGGTLVVRGPGALEARSNTFGAAGIGGGWRMPCGNIVIEGGTITAEGGWGGGFCFGGAGIGGGYMSSCGYITISGGNVNAWGGGEAAGIGGGYSNVGCGAVTIGSHVTRVFARRGVTVVDRDPFADPIGAGSLGSAVSVTLGPGLFNDLDGDEYRTIWPWDGDLSVLDTRNCDITAADGVTIHGSFSGNHRVYIAAGATVTLSNAVINGSNNSSCPWAGITCLGDAMIVLEGENAVRGFYEGNPGIQVPLGSTLAITGSGSLTARSNGNAGGIGGSVTVDDGLSDTVSGTTRTFRWNGNLSKLRGNAVATNGMTIYGTLGSTASNKVSIADYATVTLRDATIEGVNSADCPWAGITCEGYATIVLEGANVVRGFHEDYPGIYVHDTGSLTIRGAGSLAASSNGKAAGIGGGNGNGLHSGDIVIDGGTIVATGGVNSAGIGGGNGTDCWRITISGGDVTATGGANAAGIGAGGGDSSCHEVIVDHYITRVVATCGEGCSPVNGIKAVGVTVHPSLGDETSGRTRTISIPVWDGNLTGLVRDVTAVNGTVITGAYTSGYYDGNSYKVSKVSIAPGATVTLSNATINVSDSDYPDCPWAGINCLGDATIVLEGTNYVRGFYRNYPGIHVPEGSRLVIRGAGSLEVHRQGNAAGIGGGYGINCGDIAIEGGDIEVYGGEGAAAIGGGYNSSCGDITIGPGITRVVADANGYRGFTIGAGYEGTCGTITLDDLRDDHGTYTRTLLPPWDGNLAGLSAEDVVTARDGMVLHGTNHEGKVSIAAGATVTLSNAVCKAISAFPGSGWAGLACEGDATIILVGDNDIQGFNWHDFGIEIPDGCTLSVQGAGSLETWGSSAGIGGGGTVVVASGLGDTGDGATRTIRPWDWDGNLAALDRDVTAQNGMVIYGTLQGYYKVSVADGATVTLSNATINLAQRQDCEWAGINCLGNARLVLAAASTNIVKGCHIYYPGIHVPVGSTLTIAGSGVLDARSNGRGAGIGGGWNISCGNIVIESGTITAVGGSNCAAIGGGYPQLISVACGNITISNRITKVVATSAVNPIGLGDGGTCGTVTIHPDLIDDHGSPTRTLASGGVDYEAWARRAFFNGAWDAMNSTHGTYNVFLYAFGIIPFIPTQNFVLLDIEFNAEGKAVVRTPPLKNKVGFTFEVVASDSVDGTGHVSRYELNPSGETVINETGKTMRFFRLSATER